MKRCGTLCAVALLAGLLSPAGAAAMRLISLAPSVTETLFAIGAGDQVVGISTYCDYPPEAIGIDRVGSFLTPDLEAIVAKRPDLVIGVPSPTNRDPVQALERLGLKVLIVDPQTVEQIESAIGRIAAAVGRPEAGRALVRSIRADIADTEARLRGAAPRRVLMVVGQTPLVAVGSGVFQDELIHMAHGINVAAEAHSEWPHLSLEFVLARAPQVIIDTTMGTEEQPAVEAANGFWSRFPTLPAVREQHIYGYREYALLRPGPRIGSAFRSIARFIHPERFAAAAARQDDR